MNDPSAFAPCAHATSSPTPAILNALPYARQLQRAATAHKGDAGRVLLVGGAPGMVGALLLAGRGALYSGAGWVVLGLLDSAAAHVDAGQPELMLHDATQRPAAQLLAQRAPNVLALGPGLGTQPLARQWLHAALAFAGPVVLDADALNLVAQEPALWPLLRQRTAPTVLTPHPGEAARLLGCSTAAVQSDRCAALHALVERSGAVVVLKGHHTLLGAPTQAPLVCHAGNPGMAAAGMGDVLTGAVAALLAQGLRHGLDAWQTTGLAVQAHAQAGDALVAQGVGPIGLTPSELVRALRQVINHAATQRTETNAKD